MLARARACVHYKEELERSLFKPRRSRVGRIYAVAVRDGDAIADVIGMVVDLLVT